MNPLHRSLLSLAFLILGCPAATSAADFKDAGNGLSWREDRIASGPWTLEVVRIDRNRGDLRLLPTLGQGDRIGLDKLTSQVARVPRDLGEPLAAINGDFYQTEDETFPGDPRGLFITRGELVSAPGARDCFWIDRDGTPHIGTVQSGLRLVWPDGSTTPVGLNEETPRGGAVLLTQAAGSEGGNRSGTRVTLERSGDGPWLPLRIGGSYVARAAPRARVESSSNLVLVVAPPLRNRVQQLKAGGTVRIEVQTQPDLTGVPAAIGGGPALVRGGKALSLRASKSNERHPRSALGWNSRHFFLVVVDGRQEDYSDGMTLPELADYLVRLGCDEALNLDGGGSTELWLGGRILNRPCYGHERRTATGLVVLRTAAPARKPQ